MPDNSKWTPKIQRWRSLPLEERRHRHLEAIPRHVANEWHAFQVTTSEILP